MKRKRKISLKERRTLLILVVIVLFMVMLNIIFLIYYFSSKDKSVDEVAETSSEVKTSADLAVYTEDEIKSMSEQSRMQLYARNFIKLIDNEEFESAYELLNSDFKESYFSTLDAFETYVRERIGTGELTINFTNMERLGNSKTGNIYVLWADVYDVLGNEYQTNEEDDYMNIVILERDYDDYELSFSLK